MDGGEGVGAAGGWGGEGLKGRFGAMEGGKGVEGKFEEKIGRGRVRGRHGRWKGKRRKERFEGKV